MRKNFAEIAGILLVQANPYAGFIKDTDAGYFFRGPKASILPFGHHTIKGLPGIQKMRHILLFTLKALRRNRVRRELFFIDSPYFIVLEIDIKSVVADLIGCHAYQVTLPDILLDLFGYGHYRAPVNVRHRHTRVKSE